MTHTLCTVWDSPLGELVLEGDEHTLRAIRLPGSHAPRNRWPTATEPFVAAIEQLSEYFAGVRTAFDLPLDPGGSRFDHAVWRHVDAIPYGQTSSYSQIAHALRSPDRVRAVGAANARNPLPIVVPCHRVIGSDGSLTGYAGGLDRKRALLALEQGAWQESLL